MYRFLPFSVRFVQLVRPYHPPHSFVLHRRRRPSVDYLTTPSPFLRFLVLLSSRLWRPLPHRHEPLDQSFLLSLSREGRRGVEERRMEEERQSNSSRTRRFRGREGAKKVRRYTSTCGTATRLAFSGGTEASLMCCRGHRRADSRYSRPSRVKMRDTTRSCKLQRWKDSDGGRRKCVGSVWRMLDGGEAAKGRKNESGGRGGERKRRTNLFRHCEMRHQALLHSPTSSHYPNEAFP